MRAVCVLGDGQLGRMLRQAGEPLGIAVYPVGPDAGLHSVPWQQAVITAEIEHWPDTPLTRDMAAQPGFVNRAIFPQLADRYSQKQLLDTLALPSAPWQLLESPAQWPALFARLGPLAVVKCRTGGYDGRGQWRITPGQEGHLDAELYRRCIVEQGIHFRGEVSLIGARGHDGRCVFYPLTHNRHQDGILRASVVFPQPESFLQEKAQGMLQRIMQHLEYVGVMAMECFVVDDDTLLINELAPRVHNSGHWTQNGASVSQFELHLRALLGLPLPTPDVSTPSVMINLIGTPVDTRWLDGPLVHLHWYGKAVHPGRKVGHLNLNHFQSQRLVGALETLRGQLPADYGEALDWALARLNCS